MMEGDVFLGKEKKAIRQLGTVIRDDRQEERR
jgi:hypothetical protein